MFKCFLIHQSYWNKSVFSKRVKAEMTVTFTTIKYIYIYIFEFANKYCELIAIILLIWRTKDFFKWYLLLSVSPPRFSFMLLFLYFSLFLKITVQIQNINTTATHSRSLGITFFNGFKPKRKPQSKESIYYLRSLSCYPRTTDTSSSFHNSLELA